MYLDVKFKVNGVSREHILIICSDTLNFGKNEEYTVLPCCSPRPKYHKLAINYTPLQSTLCALTLLDPGGERLLEVLVLLECDRGANLGGQHHLGAGGALA